MNAPKPYYTDISKLKAFVLGCDPTAFDKQHNRLTFEYVFDLGNDERYFSGILKNLELLNLFLDQVYVQNLITDYQSEETGRNKEWNRVAASYILQRKEEFDQVDSTRTLPVFLTSEVLYRALLKPDQKRYTPAQLYDLVGLVPISAHKNLLGRPLIPLFRHPAYSLKKREGHRNRILKYLSSY